MFLDFLFRRKTVERYRICIDNTVTECDNPLPRIMPGIYTTPESPEMKELPERLEFMNETVTETLRALRVPPGPIRETIQHNCRLVVSTPAIYSTIQSLRKNQLGRYIENSHVVATLVQVACMTGESPMARTMRESLMTVLVGIYGRFYGIPFMKNTELACLRNFRRFDMDDERERELRNAFLETFKSSMERVADISSERFHPLVNWRIEGAERNQVIALDHIIRFSNRLIGRTAIDLKAAEEEDIHQTAAYVGVAYALASAHISTGKRFPVLFAESLTRGRRHRQIEGMAGSVARHNLFALTDLMMAARCVELPFFQGQDQVAFYSIPDNIYVVFLSLDSADEGVWQCFWGPKRQLSIKERGESLQDAAKNIRLDPAGEELTATDNILPMPGDDRSSSTRRVGRRKTEENNPIR